jgi:hypothetical protein
VAIVSAIDSQQATFDAQEIQIVVNWFEELQRLVPAD